MNNLIIPIGCSGSGKSTLRNKLIDLFEKDMNVVSPDDMRRENLGDVNDQSQNKRIFMIAGFKVRKSIKENFITYFDATNLNWKGNLKFIKNFENVKVIFVFMMDSKDYDLCSSRVNADIKNDVDRSNVPMDIILTQHTKFENCLSKAKSEENLPENCKIVFYNGDPDIIIKEIEWEESY